jgi:hypothetical protein
MSYIDADTLDECSRALRLGATLDYLAGKLRCAPEHLANLLGLPQWKQIPQQQASDEFDLFATDRLDAVL